MLKATTEILKAAKRRFKHGNRNEIMLGNLRDWRRVANRYDHGPKIFLSAAHSPFSQFTGTEFCPF